MPGSTIITYRGKMAADAARVDHIQLDNIWELEIYSGKIDAKIFTDKAVAELSGPAMIVAKI